jgi:hypothetical protein
MELNIEELSVKQIREIAALVGNVAGTQVSIELPIKVGEAWVFRSVTMINIGRVVAIGPDFFLLEEAGWVADTERYGEFLSKGLIREFEPYPVRAVIWRGALVDSAPWAHSLPRIAK